MKYELNVCGTRTRGNWIESLEGRRLFAADLTASISFVSPASHQVKPGQSIGASVEVFNNGDTLAAGKLTTTLAVSTNADGSSSTTEATINKSIHLAPGGHATFHVKAKVPVGFTPGTYYAVADIDPGNTFGESDLTNNLAVSANTTVVLDQFPDLTGTWSGPVIVKKGVGKGPGGTQVDAFTDHDPTTGGFTYTGTNFLLDGQTLTLAGTGTINTKNVFTDSGSDIPIDSLGELTGKGKLTGNKLVIKFANALNSGIITLTRGVPV